MLQSVAPLTLELIDFILKQQILLKHDRKDVILNRVVPLSSFFFFLTHFLTLCCYIVSFILHWSSLFSSFRALRSFNCHFKIVAVWEKQQCVVALSQILKLKVCHSCTDGWFVQQLNTHTRTCTTQCSAIASSPVVVCPTTWEKYSEPRIWTEMCRTRCWC